MIDILHVHSPMQLFCACIAVLVVLAIVVAKND
jgi:hypothetical protein